MFDWIFRRLRQMSWGGIAGLSAVLVLIGIIGFIAVAREVNTSPAQCATCHPALTAMWKRSKGHPANEVSCHQCHAAHPDLPSSLNPAVFLRDQLIPEKYLSAADRIESRCRSCHPGIPTSGTGPGLIAVKESLKQVVDRMAEAGWESRTIRVPHGALDGTPGPADGQALLFAAARDLRSTEWRLAAERVERSDGEDQALEGLREPLRFSTQSLQWARVKPSAVAEGVEKRVSVRLSQYRSGMGHVQRGIEQLQTLPGPAEEEAPPLPPDRLEEAEATLESVSRGLKSAGRARDALLRVLGEGAGDAVLNPSELARPLRVVPRGLEEGDLESVHAALEVGAQILRGERVEEGRIDELTRFRIDELTSALEGKLVGLRNTFEAVAEDLPPAEPRIAETDLGVGEARLVERGGAEDRQAAQALAQRSRKPDPAELVSSALTAIRSMQVSLEAAANLGWSDFSLSEDHVGELESAFEDFAAAFLALDEESPEFAIVRHGLETAVESLARAAEEDGVALAVSVSVEARGSAPEGGPYAVDLGNLTHRCVEELFALERRLESRNVIKINHKVHFSVIEDREARPVRLGCLDCHRSIAHDRARVETNRPRMAGCFVGSCHRKDRNQDNCRRCHFQNLVEAPPEAAAESASRGSL